ncbi:MAG TPA: hypothetical protein VFW33_07295 [Gemmataceae bacterium]|nr:hypothetical protein [Gemmataceae bacterium]
MLFVSLGLSGLLFLVVNAVALVGKNSRVGVAALLSGLAAAPFFCLTLVVPFFSAILVALAGLVCCAVRARPRWFLISSLGVTIAAYGYMGWARGVPEVRKWDQAKAKYPMESVAPRLAYEDRPRRDAHTTPYQAERVSSLERRIDNARCDPRTIKRVLSLERLHAGAVAQFANAPGFGDARMAYYMDPKNIEMSARSDESDPTGPIPQPARPYYSPDPAPLTVNVGTDPGLTEAHERNFAAFLDPFDFGLARDRDHVAGFRPHRFREEPDAPKRWKVERLELVGLLKFDEPIVYLSENLPAMDELRDAPTRPLDAFESEALTALRRGEDLMIQERSDRLRMLGSVRAVRQCLRCHHAERGDLLGAFSYRLAPDPPKD